MHSQDHQHLLSDPQFNHNITITSTLKQTYFPRIRNIASQAFTLLDRPRTTNATTITSEAPKIKNTTAYKTQSVDRHSKQRHSDLCVFQFNYATKDTKIGIQPKDQQHHHLEYVLRPPITHLDTIRLVDHLHCNSEPNYKPTNANIAAHTSSTPKPGLAVQPRKPPVHSRNHQHRLQTSSAPLRPPTSPYIHIKHAYGYQ